MARWKRFLAAYDVRDDCRRRNALRVMLDYAGDRQKSVFECHLAQSEVPLALERIGNLIDISTDRFILCRFREVVHVSLQDARAISGSGIHWFAG